MSNADSVVAITGLRKSFGHNEVLKGIDLHIRRGEVVAIIGKSGSGKSTLLRCINGLEEFQSGSLSVDGQPLRYHDAAAMRALRQPDAFPPADIGLMRALSDPRGIRPSPRELLARAESWRPWRAYAAVHLWLSEGFTFRNCAPSNPHPQG